jgi:hypothetical protein|tara:strand:- start:153 stop:536 length:384 start_codon:yes stop_codon:yes gene_type:complete
MSEQEELFPQFPPLPALAFRDGTSSGFSGTDTSEQRAKLRDLTGATSEVQRAITNSLKLSRLRGRTVGELDEELFELGHHGTISGAVSNLHKKELICRLKDKRNGMKIYVMPYNTAERITEVQGRKR